MAEIQYPLALRDEELKAQSDMFRFLTVSGYISRKLGGAERMLPDLEHPLKGAALVAYYCAALSEMPVTQSDFQKYCIDSRTGSPFSRFSTSPVFPDTFRPMIEAIETRLGDVYEKGILPLFHQAQEVAA
jgi:hypothetical protein